MEIIIVMVIFGALGQFMGRRKGYPWAGLVLGGLLGIIGIIIILCMRDRTKVALPAPAPTPELPRAVSYMDGKINVSVDKMHMRVTAKQRDAVAEELSRQFAAGTLDQEVFDTRMAAALGATQQYELDILTMDLPVLD
jgi:hypothetical protein